MDDALLVRRFERIGDLPRDRQRFVERDGAARDALRQILAFDELHHERARAARSFQPVNRGDVGMIERGEQFGFALEPGEAIGVRGHSGRQHLDGHRALQAGVGGLVDLAHASFADLSGDFVDAETETGRESQQVGVIIREVPARSPNSKRQVVIRVRRLRIDAIEPIDLERAPDPVPREILEDRHHHDSVVTAGPRLARREGPARLLRSPRQLRR